MMYFKGCYFINHKISCDLSCTLTIFLAFRNLYVMLDHMEVHSKYHLLMMDSIQIWSGVIGGRTEDIEMEIVIYISENSTMLNFLFGIVYKNNFSRHSIQGSLKKFLIYWPASYQKYYFLRKVWLSVHVSLLVPSQKSGRSRKCCNLL